MQATMAVAISATYADSPDDFFMVGTLKDWSACIWGHDWGKWSDGKDERSFWNWLYHWSAQVPNMLVYGWDMWAEACILGFAKEIADGRLLMDVGKDCFIAGPPTVLTCQMSEGGGKITMIDLENLGISKDDCNVSEGRAVLPATKLAVQAYRKLVKDEELGKVCMTAAAQCWEAFRKRSTALEKAGGQLPRSPSEALPLEGAAYTTGRCECRRL